jgi:SdpC family antimicrobial peptide
MNVNSSISHPNRATIIRRLSSGLALLLALTVTITFIDRAYSVPAATVQKTPYDGLALYRGLFFASGPVASKIPTIQKAAPYLPADYKNLEGQITKYILSKDPKYFDKFANDIQSGDRVRVADAIRRTGKLQREAMLSITQKSRTNFATNVGRLREERPPEAENDGNVAVEIVVFVLLFVTIFWNSPKSRPNELKGLSFDRYVNEIVTAVPKSRDLKIVSP